MFSILQEKPNDPDVYRLLGEVKFELKDYEGSAAAYKKSSAVSILQKWWFYMLCWSSLSCIPA